MNLTTALYQRRGSQAALVVKNLPANPRNVRDSGSIPDQDSPLEEGMAMYSNVLAWRISWTQEAGSLWSTGLQRVGHD